MGYQFYNLWPYDYTIFPTMEDHVDPVNNAYFTGLHQEIENIENVLGLQVHEGFENVKKKLEEHDHSGGVQGAGVQAILRWHYDLSRLRYDFNNTVYQEPNRPVVAIFPWSEFSDAYDYYVRLIYSPHSGAADRTAYFRLNYYKDNYDWVPLAEYSHVGVALIKKSESWIKLTDHIPTPETLGYVHLEVKMSTAAYGYLYSAVIEVELRPK